MIPESPLDHEQLARDWQLTVPPRISEDELVRILGVRINELITQDMPKLISILYRIDVDENKLRQMLRQHKDSDGAMVIAHMVVERQKQKQRSREMFKRDQTGEEELW